MKTRLKRPDETELINAQLQETFVATCVQFSGIFMELRQLQIVSLQTLPLVLFVFCICLFTQVSQRQKLSKFDACELLVISALLCSVPFCLALSCLVLSCPVLFCPVLLSFSSKCSPESRQNNSFELEDKRNCCGFCESHKSPTSGSCSLEPCPPSSSKRSLCERAYATNPIQSAETLDERSPDANSLRARETFPMEATQGHFFRLVAVAWLPRQVSCVMRGGPKFIRCPGNEGERRLRD